MNKQLLHVSMRRSIELGLNFYEWRKSQEKQMEFSDKIMQVIYEDLEENHTYQRVHKKELIVLTPNGAPLTKTKFILHIKTEDASKEGIEKVGKGNFIIELFSKFKRTAKYRACCHLQEYLIKKEERARIRNLNGPAPKPEPVKPESSLPSVKPLTASERILAKVKARHDAKQLLEVSKPPMGQKGKSVGKGDKVPQKRIQKLVQAKSKAKQKK